MLRIQVIFILLGASALFSSGCTTTNSTPYKASVTNIIAIQQSVSAKGKKVSVGNIVMAPGVEERPLCRLMGPVKVAPGKSPTQYIKEAFREELFAAQSYSPSASTVINGEMKVLKFNSFSSAKWQMTMNVNSNISNGYTVSIEYPFSVSLGAVSACQNVANAFGPAVQELIRRVVTHPNFTLLVTR